MPGLNHICFCQQRFHTLALRVPTSVLFPYSRSFVWWGETVRVVCADGYYDFDHPAQDALELVCDYTELQNISAAQLEAVTCSPMCVTHLPHVFTCNHPWVYEYRRVFRLVLIAQ